MLSYSNFKQGFVLQTDASDVGVGAILSQYDDDGVEHVITYTVEQEAFAIQFGTQHFRVYLVGDKFTIITKHNALKWLNQMEPKGWLMDAQGLNFVVKYRPGHVHDNADALSRLLPCQQQCNDDISAEISAVTLCPDINFIDTQEQDPSLVKLLKWKSKGLKCAPRINGLYTCDPYLHKMLRF